MSSTESHQRSLTAGCPDRTSSLPRSEFPRPNPRPSLRTPAPLQEEYRRRGAGPPPSELPPPRAWRGRSPTRIRAHDRTARCRDQLRSSRSALFRKMPPCPKGPDARQPENAVLPHVINTKHVVLGCDLVRPELV